jgi:hypothetical protein
VEAALVAYRLPIFDASDIPDNLAAAATAKVLAVTAGVSLICAVVGTFMACRADRYPHRRESLETVAGILLIAGFGLLGYGLSCVLGPP